MFVLTFLQRYIIYLSHYHNEPTTHPYLYLGHATGHDEHLLGCRKWEWQEITLAHSFKASEQTPNNTMAQCDINEMEVHGLLNRNSEDFTTNYKMEHKFQQFSARPGKRLLFHLFKGLWDFPPTWRYTAVKGEEQQQSNQRHIRYYFITEPF